jgi:hypothetical protein
LDFFVQTILCRDCRQLYDAVTKIRSPINNHPAPQGAFNGWLKQTFRHSKIEKPPTFQTALSRLRVTAASKQHWLSFTPQCPVSGRHRIENWDQAECPRCSLPLEKNPLPYRIWD